MLLRELGQLWGKERLLEVVHDFIVFDAGIKKICRHNQYFGVRAAQAHVRRREGGIIWHTQGSGKSLTMVWLAKWIREHAWPTPVCCLSLTERSWTSRSKASSWVSVRVSTGPRPGPTWFTCLTAARSGYSLP